MTDPKRRGGAPGRPVDGPIDPPAATADTPPGAPRPGTGPGLRPPAAPARRGDGPTSVVVVQRRPWPPAEATTPDGAAPLPGLLDLVRHAVGAGTPVRGARTPSAAVEALAAPDAGSRPVVVTAAPDATAGAAVRRLVAAVAPAPVVAVVLPGDVAAATAALEAGALDYVAGHHTPHQVAEALTLALGDGRAGDRLRRSERLWRSVVSRTADAVLLVGPDERVGLLTPAAARLFPGRPPRTVGEAVGRLHPDDRATATAALRQWLAGGVDTHPTATVRMVVGGRWRWVEAGAVDLRTDPAVGGLVVTVRDLTEAWNAREATLRLAGTDPLTGLLGRRRFARAVEQAATGGGRPVLVLVDVDDMVLLDRRSGTRSGDELFGIMAARLEAWAPPGTVLGRVGRGEFGVLLPDVPDGTSPEAPARALVDLLSEPLASPDATTAADVSAGVAAGGASGTRLFACAGLALDEARRRPARSVVVFDDLLGTRTLQRRRLRRELRGAAGRHEMELAYQPVVTVPDGVVVGFEALVRWRHPELGLLPPDRFVPLAEETGDIVDIDAWVLRQACAQLAAWHRDRPDVAVGIAVNVSARRLMDPGFPAAVADVLQAVDIPPAHLCVEVTERAVVDDLDAAAAALRALRTTGVRVAIDDFGVGFSSLAYLQRFPADHIKVDRAFVAGLGTDPVDTALVETVLDLARRLGVAAVAEGVETAAQRDALARQGCHLGQGYLWHRPMSPGHATALVLAAGGGRHWANPWGASRAEAPKDPAGRLGGDGSTGGGADEEPVAAVSAFLSHELRTPIHVIGSFTELLRGHLEERRRLRGDDELIEPATAAVEAIDRQVAHIERIVSSLRDARAVEDGTLALQRRLLDVRGVVEGLVADLAGQLGDHPVTVTAGDGPFSALVDDARLVQILTNLLTNAAKFSPAGAPIEVGLVTGSGEVRVSVVDRGPGIPLEAIGDVFRRFFTLDRRRGGSGLGLYLARGLAQAHGGDLTYRRARTGGSEFVLTLPVDDSSERTARRGPWPAGVASGGAPGAGRARRRPGMAPLPAAVRDDVEGLRIVVTAQQAMAGAPSPEAAVAVLADAVTELGGWVVDELQTVPQASVLPFDLSLGLGAPMHAAAEPLSAARIRLEAILPGLVEYARTVLERTGHGAAAGAGRGDDDVDVTGVDAGDAGDGDPGIPAGPPVAELVGSAGSGELVAVVHAPSAEPAELRRLARRVRAVVGAEGCAVRPAGPDRTAATELVAVLPVELLPALHRAVGAATVLPPAEDAPRGPAPAPVGPGSGAALAWERVASWQDGPRGAGAAALDACRDRLAAVSAPPAGGTAR